MPQKRPAPTKRQKEPRCSVFSWALFGNWAQNIPASVGSMRPKSTKFWLTPLSTWINKLALPAKLRAGRGARRLGFDAAFGISVEIPSPGYISECFLVSTLASKIQAQLVQGSFQSQVKHSSLRLKLKFITKKYSSRTLISLYCSSVQSTHHTTTQTNE